MKPNSPTVNFAVQESHYILTQVGERRIAFPTQTITGILLTERSQVLALPFYHEMILGVVHYQGQLVPLVTLRHLLEGKPSPLREVFNAVQLSESTSVPGLGLIVDQLLGHCGEDQVADDHTIERFQPQILEPTLWQPQRWTPLSS